MSFSLLKLPNELITVIVQQIQDVETLRSLARTCSRLQSLAEPALYRFIFHRSGQQVVNLREAVVARPKRAEAIQVVDSRCKWQKRVGLESLALVISKARNLKELTIESPYCNNAYGKETKEWRRTMYAILRPIVMSAGAFGSLPSLSKLTLHLSGSERYWSLDSELSKILVHPTLASLTISCAEVHEHYLHVLVDAAKTPLRRLELIECNLTLQALRLILSVPRALEELFLGENCYHKWLDLPQFRKDSQANFKHLCSTDPEAFFLALAQQKSSLQKLTYTVRGPSRTHVELPRTCKGLSEFSNLKHVTLDGICPYFEKALTLKETAPPELEFLAAKGDMFRLQHTPGLGIADDYQSHVRWTIAAASVCDHLQHVHIVSSQTFTNVSQKHRDAVVQLGHAFKERNVSMQLFKRKSHRHIPPFLYGEQSWTEELLYDTESDSGFVRVRPTGDREEDDIDF